MMFLRVVDDLLIWKHKKSIKLSIIYIQPIKNSERCVFTQIKERVRKEIKFLE